MTRLPAGGLAEVERRVKRRRLTVGRRRRRRRGQLVMNVSRKKSEEVDILVLVVDYAEHGRDDAGAGVLFTERGDGQLKGGPAAQHALRPKLGPHGRAWRPFDSPRKDKTAGNGRRQDGEEADGKEEEARPSGEGKRELEREEDQHGGRSSGWGGSADASWAEFSQRQRRGEAACREEKKWRGKKDLQPRDCFDQKDAEANGWKSRRAEVCKTELTDLHGHAGN